MFLPIEKIPIFIWGLLLAATMIFLALQENPFTQQQVAFIGFAILGIGIDVRLKEEIHPS